MAFFGPAFDTMEDVFFERNYFAIVATSVGQIVEVLASAYAYDDEARGYRQHMPEDALDAIYLELARR